MNPLQQILALLSGSSPGGGLSGQQNGAPGAGGQMKAPQASQAPQPNAGSLTSARNSMDAYTGGHDDWTGYNPGYTPPVITDNGGTGDGKGGKDDPTKTPGLSPLMLQLQRLADTGPTGYTPAIQQNLGMGQTPGYGQSGMTALMNLFMGNANNGRNDGRGRGPFAPDARDPIHQFNPNDRGPFAPDRNDPIHRYNGGGGGDGGRGGFGGGNGPDFYRSGIMHPLDPQWPASAGKGGGNGPNKPFAPDINDPIHRFTPRNGV
jgi:hypothetical protein